MMSITPGTTAAALESAHREGRHAAPDPQGAVPSLAARLAAEGLPSTGSQSLELIRAEGPGRSWGPADFERGDQVRYLSAWYLVLGVGPFGVTVGPRKGADAAAWTAAADYAKVTGRRRPGLEKGLERAGAA
jgi:hypothetical protein